MFLSSHNKKATLRLLLWLTDGLSGNGIYLSVSLDEDLAIADDFIGHWQWVIGDLVNICRHIFHQAD